MRIWTAESPAAAKAAASSGRATAFASRARFSASGVPAKTAPWIVAQVGQEGSLGFPLAQRMLPIAFASAPLESGTMAAGGPGRSAGRTRR